MRTATRALFLALLCATLAVPASAQKTTSTGAKEPAGVKVIPNIPYTANKESDRQMVDLYLPEGKKEFPVLFYIHGGGWTQGSRKGVEKLAKTFAGQGIGVVAVGYRLSPAVAHPAHIEDVAQAFAWTVANIDKYGGRKDRIFVSGHSAGGHLAALLATNEMYLKKHKLSLKNIKGDIPVSGVFEINGSKNEKVWGKDPEGWTQAAPIKNITKNCPPFLIIVGELESNLKQQAKDMAAAVKKTGVEVSEHEIKGRNHGTVINQVANTDDETRMLILEFIKKHQ